MSQQIAVRNRRAPLLTLLLAAAAAIAVTATITCSGSAAAGAPGTPNVIQAPADPPASGSSGYWAQTSCSEGDEIAFTEGWRVDTQGSYPSMYGAIDTCLAIGGGLELRDEGYYDTQARSGPAFAYDAPLDSTIVGGIMKIRVKTPHGSASIFSNGGSPGSPPIFECTTGCASGKETTISLGNPGSTQLVADLMCLPPSEGSPCETGTNAELVISSATIMLHDVATPGGTGFGGTLLNDPTSGTGILSFTAQDKNGPGVYRVSAQIDGHEMVSTTPNANEGKCVANGTYYKALNFRWHQPCPTETAAQLEIPTAAISDGQHLLKVEVEDAAGNTAAVYEHTITIENHPAAQVLTSSTPAEPSLLSPVPSPVPVRGPANGIPASESATLAAQWKDESGKSADHLTSTYGRSHEVTGKLTTVSGTPIADALIEVSQKPSSLGAMASSLASTHTGTDGSFVIHVPSLASSSIQLAYSSHLGDAQPAATRTLTLQVPASIHLTVSPHVTSVGRTIVLDGKLAGSIPPGGKKVLFEARVAGGSWIEFHNATVDSHGRFRASHHFTFPGPIGYEFRVVCEREADFPFLAGNSNVVHVWER